MDGLWQFVAGKQFTVDSRNNNNNNPLVSWFSPKGGLVGHKSG